MSLYGVMHGNPGYYRDYVCRSVSAAYAVGGGMLPPCLVEGYLQGGTVLEGGLWELRRLSRLRAVHGLLMGGGLSVALLGRACRMLGVDLGCLYGVAGLDLSDVLGAVEAQQGLMSYDMSLAYLVGLAGEVMVGLPPSVFSVLDWGDYVVALEMDDLPVVEQMLTEASIAEYDIMQDYGIEGVIV